MKCEHTNCMTCPYPDCISANHGPANQPKKKPGRKKLPPLEKKQRKQRYQHDYYEKHKKEKAAYAKKYYAEHREELIEYSRNYAETHQAVSHRRRRLSIWVTDGVKSIRIKPEKYDEYIAKGWKKGRTLKPYKLKEDK